MLFLDPLGCLFAILAFIAISLFWFSPWFLGGLFPAEKRVSSLLFYMGSLLAGCFIAIFLSLLQVALHVTSVWEGVYLALFLFIGVILPWTIFSCLLAKASWRSITIQALFFLTALIIMNGVLAA